MSDVERVLERAIENLPGHWYQGDLVDDEENPTKWCSIGHLARAGAELGLYYGLAARALKGVIGAPVDQRLVGGLGSVAEWNDHPDRLESEVIDTFKQALYNAQHPDE